MKATISSIIDPNRMWYESIDKTLKTYQLLYELPYFENKEEISQSFYNYCLKGKYFIVIALYNANREFFIQRDFSKRNQSWELVGGWIKQGETIDQALDRIVSKETGSILVEAVPVSAVNNNYHCLNNKTVSHIGLAFVGRVLKDQVITQNGVFSNDVEELLDKKDLKILRLAKNILKHKVVDPPIGEIINDTHVKWRETINKYVVKPISYNFSSKILFKEIGKAIQSEQYLSKQTILDIACGNDKSILKIAEKANLFVANDISRHSMAKLMDSAKEQKILFTNHNLLELDFKIEFDTVICKNAMHHMRNPEEIELMLNVLRKLGKRIIIIDIEDPSRNLLARMWNNYYVNFLNDQGGLFLSFDQFEGIIKLAFENSKKIETRIVSTIKGNYMLAVIDK